MGTNDSENNLNQHYPWAHCITKPQPHFRGQPGQAALHCTDLGMNPLTEAVNPLAWVFLLIASFWFK